MKIKMNSEESYEEKQELVENMLRDFYKDPNLQITEMKCFKGSKAGDNYMSVIKKVDVKGLLSNKEG